MIARKIKKSLVVILTLLMIFSVATTVTHTSEVSAASNKATVYKLLQSYGYNKAACAGIMANIQAESSFNPNCKSGSCYGLCQWTGSRKSKLKAYARKNGMNYKSLKAQVAYLNYELKTSYKSVYKTLKSVSNSKSGAYKAAYKFCYSFERPASKAKRSKQRGAKARTMYATL